MPKKRKKNKKENVFGRIQISILKKKTMINEKENPGWRQCQVSRVIRSVQLRPTHHSVILMYFFPPRSALPDLKPTRFLVNEADTSTSLHRPRSRVSTVPCIPAGPKSCLVRKMAWSWYSAWSGSSRCCVLAHRHTCSRLRDGLPRSIRLMDCGRHGEQSANCRGAADDLQSDTNQLMFGKSMPVLFLVRGSDVV